MQMKISAVAACALLVAGLSRPLLGQSLADIARQEEARRKALREPAKVLTNKDLLPPPVVSAQPAETKDDAAAKAGDGKEPAKEPAKDPAKDQAYWSGRMKALQTQLDSDQTFAAALQSQINGLTADFVARDDPAQRAVIDRNRQKAIADLSRL